MASYIPIEVQRDLEQIADDGGSPATLRKKAEDRIAQLETDLVSAALPKGKPADFKSRLCRRLIDSLKRNPQMSLNRKMVFQHALHLLTRT